MVESDEIVVAGVSGRFPKSANVEQFAENLYNKVDMTCDKEDRWNHVYPNVPPRFGKISNLEKFDASFFSMLSKHAEWTDPQMRILLEHSYEAIVDAGVSPQSLMGSKTAVLIGATSSDSQNFFTKNIVPTYDGLCAFGHGGFYLANRISYLFGLCGPSMVIDTACSSSACALDMAYYYLKRGVCDAAIVGGVQLDLHINCFSEFTGLGIISPDGVSRPFDEAAAGFSRAEAICAVFLQRRKDSKRAYAQLVHSLSNNDGFKIEGQSLPSREMQARLMEDFYQQTQVDVCDVKFIEAHATGTKRGDPQEVAAIDDVFCKNRDNVLTIGSIKSNMGHSEAASGVTSMVKVVVALENSLFPPNINITKIRTDIEPFNEGRIKVATDSVHIDSEYIAFNSFGLGGSNVHALFKRNPKEKINRGVPDDSLERLVAWSGRTEAALHTIFDDIASRPLDAEHIALLHNVQSKTPDANTYRGYGIFKKNGTANATCSQRSIETFDGIRRPIVFVFSGIGAQWHGMGRDLMNIPVFAESIDKCHRILKEKCGSFDLKALLSSPKADNYSDIVNSYLGIISIEIALTDMLASLGIKPNFILGHSVGEIGSSYADGCFTSEEALLVSYKRGVVNRQLSVIEGAMAAVGMHHVELEAILPPVIDIACHNSSQSTTISGPKAAVLAFIAQLDKNGIFTKEVACAGIPFHSRYISLAGEEMTKSFSEIITCPKMRSSKWISSTYPEEQWHENEAKFCGPKYHATNAFNPVLFEEAAAKLPKNAIVIEISPNGIFKSIMKSLLSKCTHVTLAQKGKDGLQFLFESLGRLFQCGVDMNISALYPAIEFPVSRGTPMISPKIKWNHSENHFVAYFDSKSELERFSKIINFQSEEYSFLKEHIIDGKLIVAGVCYFVLVWRLFALMHGLDYEKMKITIKDIEMIRATLVMSNEEVVMKISVQRGSGHFEISEGNMMVVKGTILRNDDLSIERAESTDPGPDDIMLQADDFYRFNWMRGYHYGDKFCSIKEIAHTARHGKIRWRKNWITFLDAMLQTSTLHDNSNNLSVPYKIDEISIDPIMHSEIVSENQAATVNEDQREKVEEEAILDFQACKSLKKITCGGVAIKGLRGARINRQSQKKPMFESYKFVPYIWDAPQLLDHGDALKIFLNTFVETNLKLAYLIVEVNEQEEDHAVAHLSNTIEEFPMNIELKLLALAAYEIKNVSVTSDGDTGDFLSSNKSADIVIKDNCIADADFLQLAAECMSENVVFISREKSADVNKDITVISQINLSDGSSLMMFKRRQLKEVEPQTSYKCIEITTNPHEWLSPLKTASDDEKSDDPIVIYSQNTQSGIVGLYNCVRFRFMGTRKFKCVVIEDVSAPKFSPTDEFYATQLAKGFSVNVYRDGQWGARRHINILPDPSSKPRTDHCFVNYSRRGNLSSLKWHEGSLNLKMDKRENLIAIHYGSLNFKDILYAQGYIHEDSSLTKQCVIGFEFSGTHLGTGERVMGLGRNAGCLSTFYDASDAFVLNCIPDHWSLAEAATIPSVYVTVYFSFFQAIKIQSGKSILIHSGSGGVGQAALNVAFAYGLEVFTTVGSAEKRKFLLENFPQLKPEHIGNSRDTTFVDMVMKRTSERGVDYVLNSLSGDKMIESINCLAQGGAFLEIGRADILKGTTINLDFLGKDIEMKSIRIDHLQENKEFLANMFSMLKRDIANGIIKPIKYTIFEASEVQTAFQHMCTGNHIGKVLLKVRDNNNQSLPIAALPRFYCNSDCSYIIAGGLGGIGLEFTQWLVGRGCRKVILSSSRGISNQYQAFKIQFWKGFGVEVVVSTANIVTAEGCQELIETALKLGPVEGIFNLAAVVHDGSFTNLTDEMFEKSLAPKAIATKHLHEASLKLCANLKHFVVFSSISCGRGTAGQSNYGMGNSVMEEIVTLRHNMGLPAKALQWGPIADVGLLAATTSTGNFSISRQSLASVLESLDALLLHSDPIVASTVILSKNINANEKISLIDMLMKILNIENRKAISMNSTFSQLGIDSLIGVEMQQMIEREYGVTLTAKEIRTFTLAELEMLVASKSDTPKDEIDIEKSSVLEFSLNFIKIKDFMVAVNSKDLFLKLNNVENNDDRKILILPGTIGCNSARMKSIGACLSLPVYVMQLFLIDHSEDIHDLVDKMTPHVVEFFKNSQEFILIGNSFGTTIGLIMARVLEEHGKCGQLIQLDGSPQVLHRFMLRAVPDRSEQKVREFVLLCLIQHYDFIDRELVSSASIDDILELAYPNDENDKHKRLIRGLISRCKMYFHLDEVNFGVLERTKITLIKSSINTLTGIHKDYGLTKYSKKPVDIKVVEGNHTALFTTQEFFNVLKQILE